MSVDVPTGPLRIGDVAPSEEFLLDKLIRNMRSRREQLLQMYAENKAQAELIDRLMRDVALLSGKTVAQVQVYYGRETGE